MADTKKILLLINSSNFEKESTIVTTIHQTLKRMGGYALYVLTNYGLYMGEMTAYDYGEAKIYDLLEKGDFDGCILEGNLIGNTQMLERLAKRLQARHIPTVTLNYKYGDFPCVILDTYMATCQLLEHMIREHHCSRINLVGYDAWDVTNDQSKQAFQDTLAKYGIPCQEERFVQLFASVKNGQRLFDIFKEKKVDDAQAVICAHDIHAIGYYLRLQEEGIRVPEEVRLCSLNHSANSIVFRPDIAGVDRQDQVMVEQACELLDRLLHGGELEPEYRVQGKMCLGHSCGCNAPLVEADMKRYQNIILSKVENGNQIGQMMRYNDELEKVDSLDDFGENIFRFLSGIRCREFLFCLNEEDVAHIVSTSAQGERTDSFSDTMVALTGYTERTGKLKNHAFPTSQLVPFAPREGDLFLFYPIHNKTRVYGYMAFVNEPLPVNIYNYRICHESLNSSIENLHRLMVQKQLVAQLNELHMRDAMTGLYNQFALQKFQDEYVTENGYMIVVIDMDGLKTINDGYGHLAGDRAICMVADVISREAEEGDLVIRYGGDEIFILSKNIDEVYWKNFGAHVNELLEKSVREERLPYPMGVSMGCCVSREGSADGLERAIAQADTRMYENKKQRKGMRKG